MPVQVQVPKHGFRWEHEQKTAEVAQIAKAVRLATALRAALALTDLRLTTEACSLLRMAGDFSAEIMSIGEGIRTGNPTREQQRFIEQHFEAHPMTPDELAAQDQVRYEGRGTVGKAIGRLLEEAKVPVSKEEHSKNTAYLNKGYDRYVHGKYTTAMELFDPTLPGFMLAGTRSSGQVNAVMRAIAGKTVEAIQSLRGMALLRGMDTLERDLNSAAEAINANGEPMGDG
jgi:hypothetical protein